MFKHCCGCQHTKTKKKQQITQDEIASTQEKKSLKLPTIEIRTPEKENVPVPVISTSASAAVTDIIENIEKQILAAESETQQNEINETVSVSNETLELSSPGDNPVEPTTEVEAPTCEVETETKQTNVQIVSGDQVVISKEEAPKPEVDHKPIILELKRKSSKSVEEEPRSRDSLIEISKEVAKDLLSAGAILSGCEVIPRGTAATPHPSKRGASLGALPQWLSQEEDEVFEHGGTQEPPATPVGKDELALRRHRFFSDLILAQQAGVEHRVRFDPLGPTVAEGCDLEKERDIANSTSQLASLINRLEAVAVRLEEGACNPSKHSIRPSLSDGCVSVCSNTFHLPSCRFHPDNTPGIVLSPSLDLLDSPTSSTSDCFLVRTETDYNMSLAAYNCILNGPLSIFLKLSSDIGGDVATHSKMVEDVFKAQQTFLTHANSSPAPANQSDLGTLLQQTSVAIQHIQEYREKNRSSPMFNHLSGVSESIPALGWVAVAPAPAPFVKEMNDAGQFYTNRVLKEFKEKNKIHAEWVQAWIQILTELQQFVKQYHTTGLVWGGKGSGVPPPPPPCLPPPPPMLPPSDVTPLDNATDRAALFAEINQGEGITASLKKVQPDMQTNKNAALRSGPAPFKVASPSSPVTKSVSAPKTLEKPPVFKRDGKKWLVEHQKGNHSLLIEGAEMNNIVYMYNCQDSTLVIKGKLNTVIVDSCKKASLVFDALVSSVEFVNCQSVQMQVLEKVPTISIDKTDGCQMYLSPTSLDVEIVSSKSSEMNIMVPKSSGDYVEFPIPEQFKTTVNANGLTTVPLDSVG